MKNSILYLAAFCLAALNTIAADSAPSVDSILNRHLKATGGKEAVEKITSLKAEGEFEMGGASGQAVTYQKAPDKYTWRVELDGDVYSQGIAGNKAWKKEPSGIQPLSERELRGIKKDARLHQDVDLKSVYPELEYKGKETRNGEQVHVLESKPANDRYDRLFFSEKTGLLVGRNSKDGELTSAAHYSDYRDADGVKRPFKVSEKIESDEGGFEYTITLKKVTSNLDVKDEVFAQPKE